MVTVALPFFSFLPCPSPSLDLAPLGTGQTCWEGLWTPPNVPPHMTPSCPPPHMLQAETAMMQRLSTMLVLNESWSINLHQHQFHFTLCHFVLPIFYWSWTGIGSSPLYPILCQFFIYTQERMKIFESQSVFWVHMLKIK